MNVESLDYRHPATEESHRYSLKINPDYCGEVLDHYKARGSPKGQGPEGGETAKQSRGWPGPSEVLAAVGHPLSSDD